MSRGLNAAARAAITSADRISVVNALSNVLPHSDGSWLGVGNAYKGGAESTIKADNNVIPAVRAQEFCEYVSASAFVHCGDGWGYLGRATDAILKGDLHSAVHLTYYSELRATMSLLASHGIYVGNNRHFALSASGPASLLSTEGTHTAAWQIMDAWKRTPVASAAVANIVRAGGEDLASWVSGVAGAGTVAVLDDLFRRLALDLETFSKDRERRNAASYRPTWLHAETLSSEAAAELVAGVWSVLEPEVSGSFPELDRILIAEVLRASYAATRQVSGTGQIPGSVDWTDWNSWVSVQLPSLVAGSALEDYLIQLPNLAPETDPVSMALSATNHSTGPLGGHIAEMLGRAAVLLRFATGASLQLADDGGLSRTDLEHWTDALGLSRGYWEDADAPDEKLDLWADVADALQAIGDRPLGGALRNLHGRLAGTATTLGQTERVVVWSFA